MEQRYRPVEKYDLVSLLCDLLPGEVLDFSYNKFDDARRSIGSGKRLQIWTDHKSELDFLLASYLMVMKERKVRITVGSFLRRFKEKEAAVFLEHLVKLKVKSKDGVEIEENAAKQLKRYILWAIEYKDAILNKSNIKLDSDTLIVPEPSAWVYYTQW